MTCFSFAGGRSGVTSLTFAVCLTLPLSFAVVGCGGGSSSVSSGSTSPVVSGQGRATFAVLWPERDGRLIPLLANSIVIVVRNAEGKIVGNAALNRPAGNGAATTTISPLPTGSLMVTAAAYPERDGTGVAQAAATAPLAIRAGSSTEIRMVLQSTIDHLEVTSANTSVGVGYSVQIAATARNASGDIVLTSPGKLRFESLSDPKIAAIDTATGILTGNTIGTVQVKATDDESGQSAITSVKIARSAPYRLTWISPPADLPYIYPEAVNANGEVVGICTSTPVFTQGTGFYWKPNADGTDGQITAIPPPAGFTFIHPYSINDRGQIVGTVEVLSTGPRFRAFLRENGQTTLLTPPTPGQNCEAFDINASGDILGTTVVILPSGATVTRPCIWRNGTPSIVSQDNLPLASTLNVSAINDSGTFVGRYTETFSGPLYAGLWSPDSTIAKLIPPSGTLGVDPQDINASGQIAGSYPVTIAGQSVRHGFFFSSGRFNDIPPPPNSSLNNIIALGVANDGTAVGYSGAIPVLPPVSVTANLRAVRWRYGVTEELGKLLPANTPTPFSLQIGTAASGSGYIVGNGFRGGTHQGFILTPQGGTGGANVGVN